MVAAAGADRAAVDEELVRGEFDLARHVVEAGGQVDRLFPQRRRLDVDLDHAGIGRDLEHVEARIGRRGIALDPHRDARRLRRALHRGDQLEIIFQFFGRRQEDRDIGTARLDRDRGAHRALDDHLLLAVLRALAVSARDDRFAALRMLVDSRGGRALRAEIGQGSRGSVVSRTWM
jgi:hypothetical protein